MSENPNISLKRCAIYTRKSTNHLLDRDINSLTTQREICGAYVTSQQYRGWVELPRGYDDGGQGGGGSQGGRGSFGGGSSGGGGGGGRSDMDDEIPF